MEMGPLLTARQQQQKTKARAMELPLSSIRFLQELGEGAFGKVYKGELAGYSTVGAVPYTYGVLPYAGVHGTNPVHAVAHTAAGLTHSSNVGICTNYVGAVVPC